MQLITVAQLLSITDAISAEYDYRAAALDGGSVKVLELYNRIVGTSSINSLEDWTNIDQFGKPVNTYYNGNANQGNGSVAFYGNVYGAILRAWQANIATLGPLVNSSIVSIDAFATYYNGITPYSCLFAPEFAVVYNAVYPTLQLSPGNVFPYGGSTASYTMTTPGGNVTINPGTALASGTISGASTTSFVAGSTIPLVNSLGSYQGYAGAQLELIVNTTALNNTGTLTVTGTNAAGYTGQTWTIPLVAAATGTVIVSSTTTKISSVQSVALTGAITAGGWILRAQQFRVVS